MRQVCMICRHLYGLKPPFEDDRETTGICPDCRPGGTNNLRDKLKILKRDDGGTEKEPDIKK